MTPMEILSKIVEAESNARAVFDEATSLQACFNSYINDHIEVLRKAYFARVEAVIAEARQSEVARADAEIAKLDKKLEEELVALNALYENERESIVLKIFNLVVAVDA